MNCEILDHLNIERERLSLYRKRCKNVGLANYKRFKAEKTDSYTQIVM